MAVITKEEYTQTEFDSLYNAIEHFKLPVILEKYYYSDARVKTKFYLRMEGNPIACSPTLNYDRMNHFILGMGMAKEYIK